MKEYRAGHTMSYHATPSSIIVVAAARQIPHKKVPRFEKKRRNNLATVEKTLLSLVSLFQPDRGSG